MAGVNKAIILGNIGQDPKVNQTQSGKTVARFTVATSKKYKQQDGSMAENTQWHNIVAWNKLAEIVRDYCHKGSKVYVEGEIESRSYEKDGEVKYITEIIANVVQLLDKKEQSSPSGAYGQQGYQAQGYTQSAPAQSAYGQQPQQGYTQSAPAQAPAPQAGYQRFPSPNGATQATGNYCPEIHPSGIIPRYDEAGRPLPSSSPNGGEQAPALEPDQIPF